MEAEEEEGAAGADTEGEDSVSGSRSHSSLLASADVEEGDRR